MKTNKLKLNEQASDTLIPNREMPNKHFMALITFLLLLPLVYFIPELVSAYISNKRFLISLISVAIIVPLLTYILIPMVLIFGFKSKF